LKYPPAVAASEPLLPPLTRRRFLGLGIAGAAVAVGAGSARLFLNPTGPDKATLTWLSPRGTLAVVDDYPIWVALGLGYLGNLGIDLHVVADAGSSPVLPLKGDPINAIGSRADWRPGAAITFPSPALLVSSIDRGLATKAVFQLSAGSTFGFALPEGGKARKPRDLTGATIAVGAESWGQIVDPLLVEAGVDPRSVRLLVAGENWLKVAANRTAGAALSWRGLERSADGRGLRHLVGDRWSQLPSNAYAFESPDHAGHAQVDGLTRFLKGVVMGLEFAQENARAAAQITYRSAPGLDSVMSPQAAVDAVGVTSSLYSAGRQRGLPWGMHEQPRWERYLAAAEQVGLAKALDPQEVYTNRLITAANAVDISMVRLDATTFELDRDFRNTRNPTGG
jgi:NitT/TauT family transport system substrate-binding protein